MAAVVVVVVVVVPIVVVVVAITVAIVVERFSFAWHIFHGYDLLVVQGRWLKHPSGAVTNNNNNNNNSSRTSGQVSNAPAPYAAAFLLTLLFVYFGLTWVN